jgi:hypothetical protein
VQDFGMLRSRHVLALALALFGPSLACKSEKTEEAPKMLTLDVSAIEPALPGKLLIEVPVGSKSELFQPGTMSIRGPQAGLFSIIVAVEPRDLARERNGGDEIVLDDPDLVISSMKIGDDRSMLSFSANVTVGERTFGCYQDTAALLGRSEIDAMVAACRTLRLE